MRDAVSSPNLGDVAFVRPKVVSLVFGDEAEVLGVVTNLRGGRDVKECTVEGVRGNEL